MTTNFSSESLKAKGMESHFSQAKVKELPNQNSVYIKISFKNEAEIKTVWGKGTFKKYFSYF